MRHLIRNVHASALYHFLFLFFFAAMASESVWAQGPCRLKVQKSDSLDWSDAKVI